MRPVLIAAVLCLSVSAAPAWADAAGDLRQGRDALRRGDYQAAVTRLTSAIDAHTLEGGQLAEAHRLRGQALFRSGDANRAAADVQQALALAPADPAALALRCQLSAAAGAVSAAEADLEAAGADAGSGAVELCRAAILLKQGKFGEAVQAFDRAIAAGVSDPGVAADRAVALALSGQPREAIAALDDVLSGSRSVAPAERAEWLEHRARLHAATGNAEQALEDLNAAMEADPDNAQRQGERLFLRARMLNELGRHDRALEDLNRAITLEQNAPDARKALLFATRGSTYAAQGQHQLALADLGGAIGIAQEVPPPVVASWYVTRARVNRAAGQPEAALSDYAAALRTAPDDVEILGERGELLLRQGRADQAFADFQKAVELAPDNPLVHSWLAWGYVEKNDYARAEEEASRTIELQPRSPLGYWDRGLFRFFLGRFAEATEDLDRAVQLDPRNPNAVLMAHIVRARAGDARADLLAERAKAVDLTRWPGPLVRMFLGEISPEEALRTAAAGAGDLARRRGTEAGFYAGEYYLIHDQPQRAAELFRQAVDADVREYVEYLAAWIELNRIQG